MITGDDYFDSQEFRALLSDFESRYDNGEVLFFDLDTLIDIADYYNTVNDGDRETAAIDAALQLYPNASPAIAYKARMVIDHNDLDEARRLLAMADDKNEYQYLLAEIEFMLASGDFDLALDKCLELVDGITDEQNRHNAMIDTANILIDYELTYMASTVMALMPDDDREETIEIKARIAICRQEHDKAIELLDGLLEKHPFTKKYWTSLATSQYMSGKTEDAMESCNYLLAIDPNEPIGLYTKASILAHQENYQRAAEIFDRYLSLPNHGPEALLDKADCMINMLKFHDAIKLCQTFIQTAKDKSEKLIPEAYYTMLMSYLAIGDVKSAKKYRKESDALLTDQQKDVIDTKITLETFAAKGDFKKLKSFVLKHFDNAEMLMLAFDSAYDHMLLGMAYDIMKQILTLTGEKNTRGYAYMAELSYIYGYKEEFAEYLHKAYQTCRNELLNVIGPWQLETMIEDEELPESCKQEVLSLMEMQRQLEQ